MTGRRRGRAHGCLAKKWPRVFSTNRSITEEESRSQLGERLEADSDELKFFLREAESSVPSCKVEEIEEYCNVDAETSPAEQNHTIWLDDRSIEAPTRECRPRPDLLTPHELERDLQIRVCSLPYLPKRYSTLRM
jgi:hypothetical protein